jgi:hypothetical protein
LLKVTLPEVTRALYGAYRLARLDTGGMAYFDVSADGFWKSFFAAVIIAPLYLLFLLLHYQAAGIDAPFIRYISLEVIAYVVSWALFPLVMAGVTKFLQREEKFIAYIVAYNWATVWQNAFYLPIQILVAAGILSPEAGSTIGISVLMAVLFYVWFITRTALGVPVSTAVALVVLDLILTVMVNGFAVSIM